MRAVLERLMGAEIVPFPSYEEFQRKLDQLERRRVEAENAYWRGQQQYIPTSEELDRMMRGPAYNPTTNTYIYPDGPATRAEKDSYPWWQKLRG